MSQSRLFWMTIARGWQPLEALTREELIEAVWQLYRDWVAACDSAEELARLG